MSYLRFFGKFLISVGFGILMFVAWTLWGTGIYTAQQQDVLDQAFADAPNVEASVDDDGRIKVPNDFLPGPGQAAFRMRIPAIDLRQVVVAGVGTEELRKGPGHYPSCRPGFERPLCTELAEVWPGERGRTIISGHRTTWGQPFYNLDRLERGDEIIIDAKYANGEPIIYEVTHKEIVPPDSTDIANPGASTFAEIVLTTCNPRYSAAQRLIVYGRLVE